MTLRCVIVLLSILYSGNSLLGQMEDKIKYKCWIQLNSRVKSIKGGFIDAGPNSLILVGEQDLKRIDYGDYIIDYNVADVNKLFIQKRSRPVEAAFILGGAVALSTSLAMISSKDDLFSIPGIAIGAGIIFCWPFAALGALTGGPRKSFHWSNMQEYQNQRKRIREHTKLE